MHNQIMFPFTEICNDPHAVRVILFYSSQEKEVAANMMLRAYRIKAHSPAMKQTTFVLLLRKKNANPSPTLGLDQQWGVTKLFSTTAF